jgi:hypothetical protein
VFISYSHVDRPTANRLRDALQAHGIAVRIDSEHMEPGEPIRAFIERSVRDCGVTLSVVSNASLLSTWVALEAFTALASESRHPTRRHIAGYLEEGFLDRGYRLQVTEKVDARLGEIEELMRAHAAARIDTNDLNDEKSRLFDLRHNLGAILERLRCTLVLSLRDDHFDASVDRIVESVREPR